MPLVQKWKLKKLRIFNEVATIVLVVVVFLMEAPNKQSSWIYALLGTFILLGLIVFAIYIYNNQRKKQEELSQAQKNTNEK